MSTLFSVHRETHVQVKQDAIINSAAVQLYKLSMTSYSFSKRENNLGPYAQKS